MSKKIIPINTSLIDSVSGQARAAKRLRCNHNLHKLDDQVQRFLNAIEPDSYIRPHRHSDPVNDETFLILRGEGAAIIFTDKGEIESITLLDAIGEAQGVHIPGGLYHTILSLQKNTVFFEIKAGPYIPASDKDFASWSPKEDTADAVLYLKNLSKQVLSSDK